MTAGISEWKFNPLEIDQKVWFSDIKDFHDINVNKAKHFLFKKQEPSTNNKTTLVDLPYFNAISAAAQRTVVNVPFRYKSWGEHWNTDISPPVEGWLRTYFCLPVYWICSLVVHIPGNAHVALYIHTCIHQIIFAWFSNCDIHKFYFALFTIASTWDTSQTSWGHVKKVEMMTSPFRMYFIGGEYTLLCTICICIGIKLQYMSKYTLTCTTSHRQWQHV